MNPNMLNIRSNLGLIILVSMIVKTCFWKHLFGLGLSPNFASKFLRFKPMFYFYTPWKQKTSDYLMFQVNMEVEH